MSGDDDWIRFQICESPRWSGIARLGVAVSGGGDSMALLHVLTDCARERGVVLEAATVDHGLRPGSAAEAVFVAKACEALDCQHETLRWSNWDGRGNLQAEARTARYRLLADWARRRELDAVALAHTIDDQAETFLMRLAREAGVDGLAAMDAVFARDGMQFWRPALGLGRADLRGYLTRRGLAWREDPSNEDTAFDRVRARQALEVLEGLGIDRGTLWGVALNLASASDALKRVTRDRAATISREQAGDVVIDRRALLLEPYEILRRILVGALVWVSGAAYPPRRDAVFDLERAILGETRHTLHGCLIISDADTVRVTREYDAVKHTVAALDGLWDGRWRMRATGRAGGVPAGAQARAQGAEAAGAGQVVRALGEGVSQCPDWRVSGLPRASLMVSPSVWAGETLVSAPIAGFSEGFSAEINHPRGDFLTSLLSD